MKYIVANIEDRRVVLLFSDELNHSDVLPFAKNLRLRSCGSCRVTEAGVDTMPDTSGVYMQLGANNDAQVIAGFLLPQPPTGAPPILDNVTQDHQTDTGITHFPPDSAVE